MSCRPRLASRIYGCRTVLVLSLLAAALPLVAQNPTQVPHPQVPIIRANTTLVDVPVLVLDKQGQPMPDLERQNFRIFDDGQPQRISGFDNEPRPVSLAIVIDTSDWNAIDQAKRSAELIAAMVIGAQGQAALYVPGPEPKRLLSFTSDTDKLANILKHLEKSPTAAQGQGSVVEPLNLAMLDLRAQPRERTRAALLITNASDKGIGAEALIESGMSDAIPVFRIAANRPANAPEHTNPDSVDQRGTGQGSQRVQAPPAPVSSRGMPTSGSGTGNLDLAPIIGAAAGLAGKIFTPHHLDYVYYTGGISYDPGDDRDFDRKLSLIGEELRSIYHLFYSPNNLTQAAAVHFIAVQMDLPPTVNLGSTTYRRSYVGIAPH
ncbi:MAG TPA: VWA domain-containing protein [Terriglobales bacterium]